MQICCTKKLMDELGIKPQNQAEESDLFCWSAHLITVNRRKTIVIVNDSNRFGFILYGLKAKDFKSMEEIILDGIRACLKGERIKDEIIEEYFNKAGSLVFTKTRDPRYVSHLNRACELVGYFGEDLNSDLRSQLQVAKRMNRDIIKINKASDYDYPYSMLIKDFEIFAGRPAVSCSALKIMIKLNLGRKTVWRRIITPMDITFRELHDIIQIIFDWKDYHLHKFEILDESNNTTLTIVGYEDEFLEWRHEYNMLMDTDARLSDYAYINGKIMYCYDYGDNWVHEIIFQERIDDYDRNHPICLNGEENAPPEDVGGISGYEEFLNIMADPTHEDYKTMRGWAESQWYKDFDIDLVNSRLKSVIK